MKWFCETSSCDFTFEDNPTTPFPQACPKCGGVAFATVKDFDSKFFSADGAPVKLRGQHTFPG